MPEHSASRGMDCNSWKFGPHHFPTFRSSSFLGSRFDIIYSLQDEDFDKDQGLRSITETLGKEKALVVSRSCHLVSVLCLLYSGVVISAGMWYFFGVLIAGILLAYEQSLVSPDDLSKVNLAFFTLNGFVSIGVFVFALLDRLL